MQNANTKMSVVCPYADCAICSTAECATLFDKIEIDIVGNRKYNIILTIIY